MALVSPTPRPSAHQPCPAHRPIASEQIQAPLFAVPNCVHASQSIQDVSAPFDSLEELSFTKLNTSCCFGGTTFFSHLEKSSGDKTLWRRWSALTNSSEGGEGSVSGVGGLPTPAPGGPRGGTTCALRVVGASDPTAQIYNRLPLPIPLPFGRDGQIIPGSSTPVAPFTHWPAPWCKAL